MIKTHQLSLFIRKGFTLIEMLLVLVIVSMIITISIGYLQQRTLAIRIDRMSAQMQQILNAGMSYYVAQGAWPATLGCLQGDNSTASCTEAYLPQTLKNPWGEDYAIVATRSNLYAYAPVIASSKETASANATIISGRLPLSYLAKDVSTIPPLAADCDSTTCYVVASVNIPGQNLNNATAVNHTGLYHNGACVPVPECPVDKDGNTMVPKIIVAPVSVSGVSDPANPNQVYPISSFTAYSRPYVEVTATSGPAACATNSRPGQTTCYADKQGGIPISSGKYWRVCLQVVTQEGPVNWTTGNGGTGSNWGQYATIMAITRCESSNAPTDSGFNVWTQ